MTETLDVFLGDVRAGELVLLPGDRSFFAFDEAYRNSEAAPVLSQSFYTASGELTPETRVTRSRLPPFFANLLPEGHLRTYLAERGGINPTREFHLLKLLGEDLPGAVVVRPAGTTPASPESGSGKESPPEQEAAYRFSLAGIQLKFSALAESAGGLTIPARGVGGDWIVKLPAQNFTQVPENEWSMLHLAGETGIVVPEHRLVVLADIQGLPDVGALAGVRALAVRRFDREAGEGRMRRIHIEDFAQVYNLYPADKYGKVSYANLANMVWTLTGEPGLEAFIRRLAFSVITGNGDMHLKNWSFVYPDGRTPELSPAYDLVSTVPYLPKDRLALTLAGTRAMNDITFEHFKKLAQKAGVPERLVSNAARETAAAVFAAWQENKAHYPLDPDIRRRIDRHLEGLALRP